MLAKSMTLWELALRGLDGTAAAFYLVAYLMSTGTRDESVGQLD